MPQQRTRRPTRATVALEEDKAWITFYRRLGDPAIAAELIQYLDADADMKHAHPALYLRCKHTLRKEKERQARARRIGQFVRRCLGIVVVAPLAALRRALHVGRDIAVECLPDAAAEPATRRVKTLAAKPDFAHERQDFRSEGSSATVPQPARDKDDSPASKTA